MNEWDSSAPTAIEPPDNIKILQDLIAANRIEPDPEREILIRDMRLVAKKLQENRPESVAGHPVQLRYEQLMPTCAPAELSPQMVRSAFAQTGCLYVPGVVSSEEVEALRNAIDGVHEAVRRDTRDPSWNNPPKAPTRDDAMRLASARNMAHSAGACLAVDTPRGMFKCCDMLKRTGIVNLARNYLGEDPVFSASKFILWRVPSVGPETGWHQDGRFLGDMHDIKSLNVWTALTDCGEGADAPGMELVLENLDYHIMPSEDSHFNWSVSDGQVDDFRKRVPVVIPHFKAGDMLLFDHWLLHRTSRLLGMTKERYAIESWFFAPSAFPGGRLQMAD